MKTKLIIIMLALSYVANAQGFFVGTALDPKMRIEGPTAESYQHLGGTWNFEAVLGWELDSNEDGVHMSRVWTGFENHNAIDYTKWFLGYERVIALNKAPIGPIKLYTGPEIGTIWRTPAPNSWRNEDASFTFGVNFEIQWEITKHLSIGANYNLFYGEAAFLKDATKWTEKFRDDFMVRIYVKNLKI